VKIYLPSFHSDKILHLCQTKLKLLLIYLHVKRHKISLTEHLSSSKICLSAGNLGGHRFKEWKKYEKYGNLDNFDNIFLNKYEKILKIKNYEYVLLLIDWWWFKFHVISLSFDSSSKTVKL
jgi:hypothetical protein